MPTKKLTPDHQRVLYGRRCGRRLRAGQKALVKNLLPKLEIDPLLTAPFDPPACFGAGIEDYWLEIGFGSGEHLAWQAENHPRVGIVGCEPFMNGVVKLLSRVRDAGLDNVRIYRDDARILVERLPESSLGRAFILFPDPWPKVRHHKRRVICMKFLSHLASALRDESELRVATDHAGYLEWILWHLRGHQDFAWHASKPGDWQERPNDWPSTRYQEKAIAAARKCTFLTYIRRSRL
ncbi:MAG: tRNA (guanine-N(7)-)-methyltransferase [Alphaproteobacteria bacterium MarineAlpha11_Bin1]|nr:MAG: tRNA (guanine-N(7)-)-methyltransferase [Alphaproteobacteria bacterium MarineAlpha11_Bin1]|tara:strand:- start:4712 stop:5422 length:711 start_codon:yes stop_codon:yes gene_type:complete